MAICSALGKSKESSKGILVVNLSKKRLVIISSTATVAYLKANLSHIYPIHHLPLVDNRHRLPYDHNGSIDFSFFWSILWNSHIHSSLEIPQMKTEENYTFLGLLHSMIILVSLTIFSHASILTLIISRKTKRTS